MKNTDPVMKSNALNEAYYDINLVAQRVVMLAIIEARQQGTIIKAGGMLRITASDYQKHFECDKTTSYSSLKSACKSLYQAEFLWADKDEKNRTRNHESRFVQRATYCEGGAYVEIMFSNDIIPLITRLETQYTEYEIKQIVDLQSSYALRLFELLMQWKKVGVTPVIKLKNLRSRLGVAEDQYDTMSNFKKRVLDFAVKEINENTDVTVAYEQQKEGRRIIGFVFKFKTKKPSKEALRAPERDENTADMFTTEGLSDKQLGRIVRNPTFMAEYNHLVTPTSPAGQSQQGWEFEMVNRLKKDASQFTKRPIREYLDY
ncbi:replication initiation protein RepM [Psychrobacter sp. AOP22-C1-22]|uniref:replication initiation protein RepM n=3 Tax=Psychrobacter TaxID=497 RepID=UPI00178891D2|nr:replication initiation protein RepM [Psychrobacter sp. FME6]MBE0407944.1 replication initiation protein [Psychrobacter sp. FME6]